MTVVHGVRGRRRKRLPKLLLAMLTALVLPALVADVASAATVSVFPTVQGAGGISDGGTYSCTNANANESVVIGCPSRTVDTGVFGGTAVVVLTATPQATPAGHWSFVRWTGCPSGDFSATCTLTASIFTSTTFSPRAIFDDSVGPSITSVSPVYSTVTDRGVSFSTAGNEPLTSVNCSIDGGPFTACGAVRTAPEGSHTVRAQGTDASGNLGAVSGPTTFRIVDTSLVSGPADFSADKRPTFTYSSLAGLRFECSIDSVVISTACGDKDPATNRASFTPPADLADGVHTFRVEAIDGPDFDRVPVVRTWRVDTTAPVVNDLASATILEGVVTTAQNATFTWGVTDVGGIDRFECQLDTGTFEPCASPKELTGLPFGARAFSVRGVDRAGNVGAAVTRRWTIAARDNDGDGFDQRSDCNDDNARINPNATDTPDNGVDENCDGADSRTPPPAPPAGGSSGGGSTSTAVPTTGGGASAAAVNPTLLSARGSARGARIVFTRLTATRVPAGALITATCKPGRGGACPFRTKRTTARSATVNLIAALAAKRRGKPGKSLTFRAPAVLTITVTRAGMAPKTLRYTMARGKFPKSRLV
jgi:hypothetical protein